MATVCRLGLCMLECHIRLRKHRGLPGPHAFHTVPKLPVPSFSSKVYAVEGSARATGCAGDGMVGSRRTWTEGDDLGVYEGENAV